jgi:two-component system phosphate regulon sensor histidine kinase PhoR
MILFAASLQSFHLENPLSEQLLHNFQLIAFLIITLIFISSNVLIIVFYNRMKARFSRGSLDEVPFAIQSAYNKLSTFLNHLQEAVLIVDFNLRIQESNKLAEKLLRFKCEKQTLFEIHTPQNGPIIDRCQLLIEKVIKNGCVFKDGLKTGKTHALYLDLIALPILGEDKVALIIQDKSSDYKILDMGKDFIANASHELRTPITIIEGFAETLRDLPTVSESMLQDITEKIIRSCHRMNGLVKHLLVLADLDNTNNIALVPCDLVSLIEGCSHLLLSVHPNACIEVLQNENEIYIEANVDLLERAIMNLFENAVKYSVSMPHITVTIKADGARTLLQIEDRGPGIPEEALPQIFNRFYRVNKDRSRERGGTGLGLSIVQSILEKHRAEIRVFSEIGIGTRFEIVFDSLTPASIHS